MGEIVEFPSNGSTGQGYLATPEGGTGPGVLVIQEWWGIVDHIRDVCERFASEGFVALAPDLYRGKTTAEPDEAGKLMMALDIERAAKDLSGGERFLEERAAGERIGIVGFCMGGGLALFAGTLEPEIVKAVVPFYGLIPWQAAQPDYSKMRAAVQGHYAADDDMADAEAVAALRKTLEAHGIESELFVYPDTDHAFFNDTRPEVHDPEASRLAWERTITFLRSKLG